MLGDPSISILEGVILPWGEPSGYLRKIVLPTLAKAFKFELNAPWGEHSEAARMLCFTGHQADSSSRPTVRRGRGEYESEWEGVLRNIERRYRESTSDSVRATLEEFMIEQPCQTCKGKRLRPGEPCGTGATAPASATWWTCRSSGPSNSSRASRCAALGGHPAMAGEGSILTSRDRFSRK